MKRDIQKKAVSVLGVSEVRWKSQGEIRSDYTVYYCGGDRAERGVAIVVHKSIVKTVFKSVCIVTESLLNIVFSGAQPRKFV